MAEFQKDLRPQESLQKLKEKKKKKEEELKSLEDQKKREIADAEKEIKERTAALERETREKARLDEEERIRELEAERDRLEEELSSMQGSLEQIVGREEVPEEKPKQIEYMIEALREERAPIYAVTNYNVYNQLSEIRNKAAAGEYITSQEKDFVEETKRQTQRFISDQDYLTQKDPHDYVSRSDDILRQIDSYVNLRKRER